MRAFAARRYHRVNRGIRQTWILDKPDGCSFGSPGQSHAGIVFTAILSVATDLGLWAAGAFPPIGDVHTTLQLLVATVYRTVFGIGGSYLTASLAPSRPMLHVMALGVLGLIVNLIGALAVHGFGPEWYSWALVVLALPTAWLAGKLHQIRSTRVPIIRQG